MAAARRWLRGGREEEVAPTAMDGGRPDDERRARSRGSRVSSKPRAAAEF